LDLAESQELVWHLTNKDQSPIEYIILYSNNTIDVDLCTKTNRRIRRLAEGRSSTHLEETLFLDVDLDITYAVKNALNNEYA